MQLVYFWGKDYRNFKEQEINFNSGFKFKMINKDGKYILGRDQKQEKKIPKNFFGEKIENISCVIGGNGSGKTTLFQTIITQKYYLTNNESPVYLSVFEENDDFYIFINEKEEKIEILFKYETMTLTTFKENIKYIYFNNDIHREDVEGIINVFDISQYCNINNTYIEKDWQTEYVSGREILLKYNEKIFQELVDLISMNYNVIKQIHYPDLKKRIDKVKELGKISVYLRDKIYKNKDKKEYLELYNLIGEVSQNLQEIFISNYWGYLCDKIIEDASMERIDTRGFTERKDKTMKKWFLENLEILKNKIKNHDKKQKFDSKNIKFSQVLNSDLMTNDYFENIINLLEEKKYINKKNEFLISFESDVLDEIKKEYLWNEFFGYRLTEKFSSGEIQFLTLLKNILNLKTRIEDNGPPKSVIFFLEEIESFMHPEWQRKIIDSMVGLSKIIPWMDKIKIQYIFASHTPFLVGDLPEGNVSYFEDGKIVTSKKKIFGGNIFEILKKNFLMSSHFGEFASNKIEKVIELLSKKSNSYRELSEEEKQEVEFIIDSIGEVLIRKNLEIMYKKYRDKVNTEEKVEELKELKYYLNDKNMTAAEAIKILEDKVSDKN